MRAVANRIKKYSQSAHLHSHLPGKQCAFPGTSLSADPCPIIAGMGSEGTPAICVCVLCFLDLFDHHPPRALCSFLACTASAVCSEVKSVHQRASQTEGASWALDAQRNVLSPNASAVRYAILSTYIVGLCTVWSYPHYHSANSTSSAPLLLA